MREDKIGEIDCGSFLYGARVCLLSGTIVNTPQGPADLNPVNKKHTVDVTRLGETNRRRGAQLCVDFDTCC